MTVSSVLLHSANGAEAEAELDIEAYKICQNRTLCELVRRRRNDANWAVRGKTGNDDTSSSFSSVSDDLVECWGIGASKQHRLASAMKCSRC